MFFLKNQDCFNILFVITLDGNKSRRVGNWDALELLVRIALDSKHMEVKLQALRTIQDILSLNPLNVVDLKYINGISQFLELLQNYDTVKKKTLKRLFLFFSKLFDFKQKNQNPDEFIFTVSDLLIYIGILQSQNNAEILLFYLRLLSSSKQEQFNFLILNGILRMASDFNFHGSVVPDSTLSVFIEILKKLITPATSLILRKNQMPEEEIEDKIQSIDEEYLVSPIFSEQILIILETIGVLIRGLNFFLKKS